MELVRRHNGGDKVTISLPQIGDVTGQRIVLSISQALPLIQRGSYSVNTNTSVLCSENCHPNVAHIDLNGCGK